MINLDNINRVSKFKQNLNLFRYKQSLFSVCGNMISKLGGLKEYYDFNNVTLADEDVTQVRQTRSSSPHPVYD